MSPRSLPVRARAPDHLAPPRVPRRGLRRLADLPATVLAKLSPELRRRLEAVPWHRRDEGPEILDAMLRFTGSAGFDEVLEAWSRLGTDPLADNARRGAAHVIRFASANVDPRLARFEAGVPSFERATPLRPNAAVRRDWMDFGRVADIVEPGHRYELKSVREFRSAYVKQLTRDLASRLSSDPHFADSLTWVFDRNQLRGTTRAQLVRQILDAIEKDALLSGYGDRLPGFRAAIHRMVRIWPE